MQDLANYCQHDQEPAVQGLISWVQERGNTPCNLDYCRHQWNAIWLRKYFESRNANLNSFTWWMGAEVYCKITLCRNWAFVSPMRLIIDWGTKVIACTVESVFHCNKPQAPMLLSPRRNQAGNSQDINNHHHSQPLTTPEVAGGWWGTRLLSKNMRESHSFISTHFNTLSSPQPPHP